MPASLFGSGFTGALTVTVGGNVLTFTVLSDGRIDLIMPPGIAGTTVSVTVETADAAASLADAFRYLDPESGQVDGETGGVVTTTHGATMTIPGGGPTGWFVLTYTSSAPPEPPPGNVLMHSFELDAEQNGEKLDEITRPITIELVVDPSIPTSEERPWLYEYVETGEARGTTMGMWVLVPNQRYDASTGTVTASLSRMGRYALSTVYLRRYLFPIIPLL
jgi:hypothetical protein